MVKPWLSVAQSWGTRERVSNMWRWLRQLLAGGMEAAVLPTQRGSIVSCWSASAVFANQLRLAAASCCQCRAMSLARHQDISWSHMSCTLRPASFPPSGLINYCNTHPRMPAGPLLSGSGVLSQTLRFMAGLLWPDMVSTQYLA